MSSGQPSGRWNVRLWPGLLLVALVAFGLFAAGRIAPATQFSVFAFVAALALVPILAIAWWVTFARATRPERVWVPLLYVLPGMVVAAIDVAGRPEFPMLPILVGLPFVLAVWVGWLTLSIPLAKSFRLTGLAVLMVCGWVAVGLVKMDGTSGDMLPNLVSRFADRPEDAAKRERDERTPFTKFAPLVPDPALDWAEFRGQNRDGVVTGAVGDLDWAKHPPKLLWKQKIGPGWGTFIAVGDRLFTQEQLGDNEAVVCYDAATGGEIWRHEEQVKFSEPISQAGPRATPTFTDGKVYAQGATGLLVCLNAEDGKEIWKTDIKAEAGGVLPQWGYASSPLVLHGKVIVYTGGPDGKGTSAFDAATGKLAWSAGKAAHGYGSAQRVTIAGVEQVLMLSDFGLESFDPLTGKVLWDFNWPRAGINRSLQPTVLGEGEFLISTGYLLLGTKRLKVTKQGETWVVGEVWFTRKVHPYFNDAVVFDGHYYGFSGKSFVCMSLMDGSVKWDAGTKYGSGQVLLVKDAGMLVVQAVDGRVFVVKATPEDHTEEAKLDALDGKTWNHPMMNRGRLYVRNGEEAAAFELKLK